MLTLVIAQYGLDYEWYLRKIGVPKNTTEYRKVCRPEDIRAYQPGKTASKIVVTVVPRGTKLDSEIEKTIEFAEERGFSLKYES